MWYFNLTVMGFWGFGGVSNTMSTSKNTTIFSNATYMTCTLSESKSEPTLYLVRADASQSRENEREVED